MRNTLAVGSVPAVPQNLSSLVKHHAYAQSHRVRGSSCRRAAALPWHISNFLAAFCCTTYLQPASVDTNQHSSRRIPHHTSKQKTCTDACVCARVGDGTHMRSTEQSVAQPAAMPATTDSQQEQQQQQQTKDSLDHHARSACRRSGLEAASSTKLPPS